MSANYKLDCVFKNMKFISNNKLNNKSKFIFNETNKIDSRLYYNINVTYRSVYIYFYIYRSRILKSI